MCGSLSLKRRYRENQHRSRQTSLGEWLLTGDKYYQDKDGYLWQAGRPGGRIKIGGIWVSPVEVESSPIGPEAVVECAGVAQADEANLVKPKDYVVLKEGHQAGDTLAQERIANARPRV